MFEHPKSKRKWRIRNTRRDFWQRGSGGWGTWADCAIYTEDEKHETELPQGGTWEVAPERSL